MGFAKSSALLLHPVGQSLNPVLRDLEHQNLKISEYPKTSSGSTTSCLGRDSYIKALLLRGPYPNPIKP
jgi:hypothetical protein